MESIGTSTVINIQETLLTETLIERPARNNKSFNIPQKEELLRDLNIDVYDYLTQHVIPERQSVCVMDTNQMGDLNPAAFKNTTSFINLRRINDARYINQFLIKVNQSLPDAGMFIGCMETVAYRKEQVFKNGKNVFNLLFWLCCFIFHRVFPKTKYFQKLYFGITRGKYRWLTKAEVLGRLVSCGFDIIEFKFIEGKMYFTVMKTSQPDDNKTPSFGPLFPMKRVGKNGKLIKVYKLRTMHPYSEYLQSFVIKLNGYNEVGKPANDFRLAGWGKIFRKYWLDELPQLINVLKGDLAIVGVRPLSKTRFNELPKDIQKERIKYRPGCIPPYVALLMPDSDGNIEAERIYLEAKKKHRYWTDVKFFFLAVWNILSGKITSS